MKALSLAAATAALLALTGCGGAATVSQPAVVFPSSDEVARIPARKARAEAFGTDTIPVEEWTFESVPIPDGAGYDDPSPWGDLLREQVKAHAQTTALSPPLLCTARELARFNVKKQALPAESLRRFMAARCGVVASSLSPSVTSAPVPAEITDPQLAAQFRTQLGKLFDEKLRDGHFLVGLAVARDAGRASIALVVAEDDVRLEPGSRSVDAKRQVTLRGGVRGEFAEIGALVNRGDSSAAPCQTDESVRPPQFSVRCEIDANDRFAWVEVVARKQGSRLLREIAETVVYQGDAGVLAYTARHLGPPAPAATEKDLAALLVERLNGVRRAAKLAPLSIALKQSSQNARLAGTLVDAMFAKDDGSAELAALGLLAGWDVEGLIRTGNFFVGVVAPERDAASWLDSALELPLGRTALLDPDARQIAVGPVVPDGVAGVGAAVTTYSFFQSDDHTADEDRFFERLTQVRVDAGLPAPVRITGFDRMRVECTHVLREGKPPMAALQDLLDAVVQRTGKSAQGYVLETSDLTHVDVPRQLLAHGPMEVVLGVTHHRAPGAVWGQYVVFALVLGAAPQMTASGPAPAPGPSRY
jgi:hypothetical protein